MAGTPAEDGGGSKSFSLPDYCHELLPTIFKEILQPRKLEDRASGLALLLDKHIEIHIPLDLVSPEDPSTRYSLFFGNLLNRRERSESIVNAFIKTLLEIFLDLQKAEPEKLDYEFLAKCARQAFSVLNSEMISPEADMIFLDPEIFKHVLHVAIHNFVPKNDGQLTNHLYLNALPIRNMPSKTIADICQVILKHSFDAIGKNEQQAKFIQGNADEMRDLVWNTLSKILWTVDDAPRISALLFHVFIVIQQIPEDWDPSEQICLEDDLEMLGLFYNSIDPFNRIAILVAYNCDDRTIQSNMITAGDSRFENTKRNHAILSYISGDIKVET